MSKVGTDQRPAFLTVHTHPLIYFSVFAFRWAAPNIPPLGICSGDLSKRTDSADSHNGFAVKRITRTPGWRFVGLDGHVESAAFRPLSDGFLPRQSARLHDPFPMTVRKTPMRKSARLVGCDAKFSPQPSPVAGLRNRATPYPRTSEKERPEDH